MHIEEMESSMRLSALSGQAPDESTTSVPIPAGMKFAYDYAGPHLSPRGAAAPTTAAAQSQPQQRHSAAATSRKAAGEGSALPLPPSEHPCAAERRLRLQQQDLRLCLSA